jgi:hypothetical protein
MATSKKTLAPVKTSASKMDGLKQFERSKKDVEPKGMKEGSKREEALDRKQAGYKSGGMVKGGKC